MVRPLRNISRKELALHAHFRGLPFRATPRLQGMGRATVNSLCDAFVADLHVRAPTACWRARDALTAVCSFGMMLTSQSGHAQASLHHVGHADYPMRHCCCSAHRLTLCRMLLQVANAGALSTVMKTACKLRPFDFNDVTLAPPPPHEGAVPYASQRHADEREAKARHTRERARAVALRSALCTLCRAPLHPTLESAPGHAVDRVDACAGASSRRDQCCDHGSSDGESRVQRPCRSCKHLCAQGACQTAARVTHGQL